MIATSQLGAVSTDTFLSHMSHVPSRCNKNTIKTKTAAEVTFVLVEVMARHSYPEVIITDKGREFCSSLNDILCERLNLRPPGL